MLVRSKPKRRCDIKTFTVKTPGRICLLGDNADLIEKPAIAATISAYLSISLTRREDKRVILIGSDIDFREEFDLDGPLDLSSPLKYITAVLGRFRDRVNAGFEVHISSDIPISAGLSSSAALCIASIRVLSSAFGIPLSPGEVAELAFEIESGDLQVECGRMDQYAIAFGGVTYIETDKNAGVEKLPESALSFIVADTQEQHDTKELQTWLRERIEAGEKLLLDSLGRVVDIVNEGKSALIRGDITRLGILMNKQQEEEKIMGTSTDRLELFCRTAREAGALGAKQMGAGGGGCVIALAWPEQLGDIKTAMESMGAPVWNFQIVEA